VATTLLIVDDHAGFRRVAREMLGSAGFDVAGEAADGAAALNDAAQLNPDVVLLDIQLPDIDGFEVARRMAQMPQPPDVVLVSSRARSAYRDRIAICPVRGFIQKEDLSGDGLNAVLSSPT
jgi:DNA-binding NarL/FixJ family response regulator